MPVKSELFDEKPFLERLNSFEYFTVQEVARRNQVDYLLRYLQQRELNCAFMVMEPEYISNDYLYDYGAYYSTCFKDYPKKCHRLHLFSNPFSLSNQEFEILLNSAILAADNSLNQDKIIEIQKQYIGSIVIKPLTNSVIGFTILKPHKETGNEIVDFWGTRPYTNHLHGLPLHLRSLAFQEQDRVLSACATISIWSMLQGAAEDYHVTLKTPGEITMAAGNISESTGSRLFPNNGLTLQEMAKSITSNGLLTEVEIFDLPGNSQSSNKTICRIKELVEAYSQIHIPILLIMEIREKMKFNPKTYNSIRDQNGGELHAVALCGSSSKVENEKSGDDNFTTIPTTAYKIQTLYANDDGYGPFTTIGFDQPKGLLITEWSKNGTDVSIPYCMMVPVYPLIRVPLKSIETLMEEVGILLKNINFQLGFVCELEYKLRAMPSEGFKKEVKNNQEFNTDDPLQAKLLQDILTKPFPKYVWIASVFFRFRTKQVVQCPKIIDFVFDATGFPSSLLCEDELFYNMEYREYFYNYNWLVADQFWKIQNDSENLISIRYYYLRHWASKSKLGYNSHSMSE